MTKKYIHIIVEKRGFLLYLTILAIILTTSCTTTNALRYELKPYEDQSIWVQGREVNRIEDENKFDNRVKIC